MSALAATQADGFYHPPEVRTPPPRTPPRSARPRALTRTPAPQWNPQKQSRASFQNSKGSNQYETHGIIRFELPFDGWCLGCERHLGKGTRFNAKKEQAGNYHTTKIWAFSMKCATCPQRWVIKTDPANMDYDYAEGIRRKVEEWDEHADGTPAEALELAAQSAAERAARAAKAGGGGAARLEKEEDQKRAVAKDAKRMNALLDERDSRGADDFAANQALRRGDRRRRMEKKKQIADGKAKGLPASMPLLTATAADARAARDTVFRSDGFARAGRKRRAEVATASIFGDKSAAHHRSLGAAMRLEGRGGGAASAAAAAAAAPAAPAAGGGRIRRAAAAAVPSAQPPSALALLAGYGSSGSDG